MKVTSREFVPYLRPRENTLEIFSKDKSDLDLKNGKIHTILDDKDKPIGHKQIFEKIAGYIDDIIVQKRFVQRGNAKVRKYIVDIHFESGKEPIIIQFDLDGGYGQSFATTLRNINIKKEICIRAWQFPAKDGQKYGKAGLSFYLGDAPVYDNQGKPLNKIEPYWTKDNSPNFMKNSRGDNKFDKEAFGDWLFEKFIEEVHYLFGHYEKEPEKEENVSKNDSRDGGRDDNRNSGSNDRREETKREEPRYEEPRRTEDRPAPRNDYKDEPRRDEPRREEPRREEPRREEPRSTDSRPETREYKTREAETSNDRREDPPSYDDEDTGDLPF